MPQEAREVNPTLFKSPASGWVMVQPIGVLGAIPWAIDMVSSWITAITFEPTGLRSLKDATLPANPGTLPWPENSFQPSSVLFSTPLKNYMVIWSSVETWGIVTGPFIENSFWTKRLKRPTRSSLYLAT